MIWVFVAAAFWFGVLFAWALCRAAASDDDRTGPRRL